MKSVTFPRKAASLLLTLNAMSNSSRVSQGTITGIYGMLRLTEMKNLRDPLFPFVQLSKQNRAIVAVISWSCSRCRIGSS